MVHIKNRRRRIWPFLILLLVLTIYYFAMRYTTGLLRLLFQLACFNTGMMCAIAIGWSVFNTLKNKKGIELAGLNRKEDSSDSKGYDY